MKAQSDRGDDRNPSIDTCTLRTMEILQTEAEDAPLDEDAQRTVEFSEVALMDSSVIHLLHPLRSALGKS
jgi:hypothetical protein